MSSSPSPAPLFSWRRWLLLAAIVLAALAAYRYIPEEYRSLEGLRQGLDSLRDQVAAHPLLAPAVFFGLYVAVTALSLPGAAVLSLAAGALFDFWLGTALADVAATAGATLALVSSRYLFRDLVRERFGPRLERINRRVEQEGAYYLFTLRLVPAVPFFLINLAMGLTTMRVWTFWWVSLLGMLPGAFVYVNAGTQLARVRSWGDVASPALLVSLALLGLVPLLLRIGLKARERRLSEPQP